MNANNLLFRPSSVGNIMTESKTKNDLSDTCKKHLIEKYIYMAYGIEKEFDSKYMYKGTQVEEDSMTLLSLVDKKFYKKNEKILSNDYVIGTPDIITDEIIIDIKSAWDIFSFLNHKTEKKISSIYYWQVQCYMWLSGLQKAKVSYCLVDTPQRYVNDEIQTQWYKLGKPDSESEYWIKTIEAIEKRHKYNHIEKTQRVHSVDVEYSGKDIDSLIDRINLCRKWLNDNFFNK
jgi:hypothetical protein